MALRVELRGTERRRRFRRNTGQIMTGRANKTPDGIYTSFKGIQRQLTCRKVSINREVESSEGQPRQRAEYTSKYIIRETYQDTFC